MAEDTDKPNVPAGKSTVRLSEWKIERANGVLVCAEYVTTTTDGVEGEPVRMTAVPVEAPDLKGTDIEMIARFAMRFGFNLADLAEQCRESDYQANARTLRNQLIEQTKKRTTHT